MINHTRPPLSPQFVYMKRHPNIGDGDWTGDDAFLIDKRMRRYFY